MKDEIPEKLTIRWADKGEWSEAMTMVWKTFLAFEGKVYSKQGIKDFFDFITDDKLYRLFLMGKYQVLIACANGRIVGVASLRSANVLSLLFVEEGMQKRGIGTGLVTFLWEYLIKEAGETKMVVNAANGAVGFYKTLGFAVTAPVQSVGNIQITPMEKKK